MFIYYIHKTFMTWPWRLGIIQSKKREKLIEERPEVRKKSLFFPFLALRSSK